MTRTGLLAAKLITAPLIDTSLAEALYHAAATGDAPLVSAMVGCDTHIDTPARGALPLHAACATGKPGVVALLLQHGADVSAKTHLGDTPLHLAAMFEHLDVMSHLLNAGGDTSLEARNNNHDTPLDLARARCHPDGIALLQRWAEKQPQGQAAPT